MLFLPSAANVAKASLTFSGLTAFTMLALLGHHRVVPHLISLQPAAAPAPEPAPADYCADVTDAPVTWNADSNRCVPDVCRDSRLGDLADVSGEVAASVICKTKLFDSAAARSCLANKHLLLLGDSTTGETAHDLTILLSGIAANRTLLTDYMRRGTRVQDRETMRLPLLDYGDGKSTVDIEYFASHRHMRIRVPAFNITIRYRFTGHYKLRENFYGIRTFTHSDFQAELACLLGDSGAPECPRPNIVLLNSGLHDARDGKVVINHFEEHIARVAARLGVLAAKFGTRVFWVGSKSFRSYMKHVHYHVEVMGLDTIAKDYMAQNGLPFIDLSRMMQALVPFGDTGHLPYTSDSVHWGSIAFWKNEELKVSVSTMLLQEILGVVCKSSSTDSGD